MSGYKLPNCWSQSDREKTEDRFETAMLSWSSEWFVAPDCKCKWYWNKQLFGCVIQELSQLPINQSQWLIAASEAVTGQVEHQMETDLLRSLAGQMRNALYEQCGWQEPDSLQQCAAIAEVRLKQDLVLFIPIASLSMPREKSVSSGKVSSHIFEQVLSDTRLRLSSRLKSLPMTLGQVFSLKEGDRVILEQRCDSVVSLYDQYNNDLIQGFLASNDGHRAIVVKRGESCQK